MITPDQWYDIGARALTAIRQHWPVTKLELLALEGFETPVSGDVLGESRSLSYNRAMTHSTCSCGPLPKLTEAERAILKTGTAAEVIALHRARHAGTHIVSNGFSSWLYEGKEERGTRIELSCGAAIGLPFVRFGR